MPTWRTQLKLSTISAVKTKSSLKLELDAVDNELARGEERAALSLVKGLQGQPGGLRCFGAARQV